MSAPAWLEAALRHHDLTPLQRLVLIELKRMAGVGAGEGSVRDVALALGLDQSTVMYAILRLQHVHAIDLVLRDTRLRTAWFDFGPAERVLT